MAAPFLDRDYGCDSDRARCCAPGCVPASLSRSGTHRCHESRLRNHCKPTADAWYGNGVAFAATPPARRHESDRSKESGAVISRHGACGSLPAGRVALLGAPAAADPVADTTVPPADEPQVLESWPAIRRAAAQHRRWYHYRESPSCDTAL